MGASGGRSRSALGAGFVGGVGVVSTGIHVVHALTSSAGVASVVFGVTLPLLLSVLLVFVGYWLAGSDLSGEDANRIAIWCSFGMLTMAVVGALGVLDQSARGVQIVGPVFVVANNVTGGAFFGFIVGLYDVRGRRRTADLRESEQMFHQITENVREFIWLAEDDMDEVLFVNPAFERIYGRPREDVYERPATLVDAVHPEDREAVRAAHEHLRTGETSMVDDEYRIQRPDGAVRWLHDRAIRIEDANGGGARIVGVAEDVTGRKRRERQLAEEREKIEFLNSILRHHLLNGMNILLAKAESVRERLEPAEQDDVDTIVERGTEMVELVQTVREVVRSIEGDDTYDLESVNLSRALAVEVQQASDAYDHASVSVVGDIPGGLRVIADDMLQEVFENILNNAVQHNDTPDPHVEVGVEATEETVVVRIADDGPGIPPEQRDVLFQKGARDVSSTGSGFGLYIVAALVDRYGGDLELSDNEPRGAVFELTFRRTSAEADADSDADGDADTATDAEVHADGDVYADSDGDADAAGEVVSVPEGVATGGAAGPDGTDSQDGADSPDGTDSAGGTDPTGGTAPVASEGGVETPGDAGSEPTEGPNRTD